MKLSRSLAIALFFTLSNGAGGSAQTLGDFTLARGRVGALRIGMTADEVVASFGRQRVKRVDVYLEDPTPTPALENPFWKSFRSPALANRRTLRREGLPGSSV
jgi:hypothetical protein